MRFYLDENLSWRIAEIGRSLGLDITSSHEQGMNGSSDAEQLGFAAGQERCLVTVDGPDFLIITTRFLERQLAHEGVLVLSRRLSPHAFAAVAHALRAYEEEHPGGVSPYGIDYVGPVRNQQRRSP